MLGLDGQVAIVTGAGRGLGRAHALALANRGALVVVNDVGSAVDGAGDDQSLAATVVGEIEAMGGIAVASTDSIVTPEGGAAVVTAAVEAFGGVDIVINNAGILRDQSFHKLSSEALEATLDVHIRGAINVTRPAWAIMREAQAGRVINTTSNAGLLGNFGQSSYSIAKMGLVGFTRTLAIEGERVGIRVNAIAPIARTRMTEGVLGLLADELDPQLVSPLVVLLAHADCPTSGAVYTVGAGRIARYFVGLTRGWLAKPGELTPEAILEHLAEVEDHEGYLIPDNAMAELEYLRDALQL